jgi:hypothetical protein
MKKVQKALKIVHNPLEIVQKLQKIVHNPIKKVQNSKPLKNYLYLSSKKPDSSWNQGFFILHMLNVVHFYKLHQWYRRQDIHHRCKKQQPVQG